MWKDGGLWAEKLKKERRGEEKSGKEEDEGEKGGDLWPLFGNLQDHQHVGWSALDCDTTILVYIRTKSKML